MFGRFVLGQPKLLTDFLASLEGSVAFCLEVCVLKAWCLPLPWGSCHGMPAAFTGRLPRVCLATQGASRRGLL